MHSPDPSLVLELVAYDKKLRIRWGRHTEKWLIERHHPHSDPRLVHALPPADDAAPIRKDLWEGWREGYVHVLTVAPELAHWRFIAPELARLDNWRRGGIQSLQRELDEDAVKFEERADKKIDNYVEAATDDAYEHMAWFTGRRVAVTTPELPLIDSGLGFKVRDRRGERTL
jgi:hypothetical protein